MANRERANQNSVVPVRIKVCGLTNLVDAQVAVDAGADLLGFIFYEKCPRYVPPATVRQIIGHLIPLEENSKFEPWLAGSEDRRERNSKSPLRYVGVFVNTPAQRVAKILDHCGLHLAQLHGEEGAEHWDVLQGRAYKALRPASVPEAHEGADRFAGLGPGSGPDLLIDAYHPALRGGTGETADWQMAADLARQHRLLLAGGLTPDNVSGAIRQVQPWGVDVSSGVEAEPGRKDHSRLRAFVAAAK
jgi:phosphoribosylanthranilate isomerase